MNWLTLRLLGLRFIRGKLKQYELVAIERMGPKRYVLGDEVGYPGDKRATNSAEEMFLPYPLFI